MLHLAQVQEKNLAGQATLQLLAYQNTEYTWVIHAAEENPLFAQIGEGEGVLVLLELSSEGQVEQVRSAKDWVLALIEQYLTSGIMPTDLQQEEQRAEQWRQSLTLQSQELGRRALEMEARRDQFQELEENLKREKEQLEMRAAELARREVELESLRGDSSN